MKVRFTRKTVGLIRVVLLCGFCLLVAIPNGLCKEPSLTAIELFSGSSGAAYIQLSDVLINTKAELRECSESQGTTIDKSVYGKLPKILPGVGGVLERRADGILRYTTGDAAAICVVPSNVKFEHNAAYSLSELADQAQLRATAVGPASDGSALDGSIKKGVKLFFVASPDVELAEYLRAQRSADIAGWRAYLDKHSGSVHGNDAKVALASLYLADGERSLEAFQKSSATDTPDYSALKEAKSQVEAARALVPTSDQASKLLDSMHVKLGAIVETGRAEIDAYHAALTAHGPGYGHLIKAKRLSEEVVEIDASYQPGLLLRRDVQKDNAAYESALQVATTAMGAKEMVKAWVLIEPYRSFASEDPRISGMMDSIYSYHMDQGGQVGGKLDWAASIAEFEKAAKVKETPEVEEALKNAHAQLVIAQDEAAAKLALDKSKAFESDHDAIQAYEVLGVLSPSQQALVKADMERLTPAYIQAAVQQATTIGKAHDPIRGLNDAFEISNAYGYYQHAYDLSNHDDSYLFKMNLLGDELSAFYLTQANRYLAKPEGSGTELGWAYIQEALAFKASNQDKIRDARTGAESAHSMHSRLSIQVQFRDGTSQRDSQGFASQLENAIIAGLEKSSISVKAVRFGESSNVKPDYQLIGDVQQHHISDTATPVAMESTYYAGEHEEINEAWNKANRDHETAAMELQSAQSKLQGAEAKGNKKTIEDLNAQVISLQKKVSDAHVQLDSIQKSKKIPVEQRYTYTKKTIDYKGIIQLQFRIGETLNGQMTDFVPVTKQDHQQVVILEGVNAVDTKGIKPEGNLLDKNEMLAGLEKEASDALIESVRLRVEALPKAIYDGAKRKESDQDMDGAAEAYLRYLNSTRGQDSPEHKHAVAYLQDQFHLRADANVAP